MEMKQKTQKYIFLLLHLVISIADKKFKAVSWKEKKKYVFLSSKQNVGIF